MFCEFSRCFGRAFATVESGVRVALNPCDIHHNPRCYRYHDTGNMLKSETSTKHLIYSLG
ncbi:hypothetical protein D083_2193 [Dickeya solani RNS 08.23.3.1.A]|nr:hypothetical protein D083_2193 [Dickeya solani RNS 08.23.3.1.A]